MGFFQPGDSKIDTSATPSPAAQAQAKFRAGILAQLLNAAAQPRPSFAQFAGGAALPAALPSGLSAGVPALLQAMNQPGAFTATKNESGHGPTPSTFSDIAQLGLLGSLLYQSGILGGGADALSSLSKILQPVGGALSIGNVPSADLSNASTGDQNILGALAGLYGDQGSVPAAGAGDASANLLSSILSSGNWY